MRFTRVPAALILGLLTAAVMPARLGGRIFSAGEQSGGLQGPESRGPTPTAILGQAQQCLRDGDLSDARQILLRALKQYPHDATLLNFLGVVEAEENHFRAAETNFREAILESPTYVSAYLNLGHLYQTAIGKRPEALSEAVRTYEKLLKHDPGDEEAISQLAALQVQQRNFRESLRNLLKLPSTAALKPANLAILCTDHAALGRERVAVADARRLLASSELTETDVLPVISVLSDRHQTWLEMELLEGLNERHLASPNTLNLLGMLDQRAGRLNEARQVLEQASRAQPDWVLPLMELARIADQQHEYRAALGYLAHARALQPQNAGIHFFFGMVCVETDLQREAYISLKKAVALDPGNPYYNYALGAVISAQREDAGEAILYFRRYCALKPQDPRGGFALGVALYYSHDLRAARAELLKVADDDATFAGANYYLGRIAADFRNWPEASQYLERAINRNPHYADAYATLGDVYLNQKNYRSAEIALERALEIDPDNYMANLKLAVLYERTKDPRAKAQSQRFAQIRSTREQRAKLFLRTIRVVP